MSPDHTATQEVGVQGGWPAVLDAYRVQFLALDIRNDSDLLPFFRSHPGWIVDFKDEEAVLFVREEHLGT